MTRCAFFLVAIAACGSDQSVRDLCDEGLCAPGTLTWAIRAESYTASAVTAVAITPDEPPWFAGTYDEALTIEDTSLVWDNAGMRDPFLARTGVRRLETLLVDDAASYPQRVVGLIPDAEDGAIVFSIGQQEDTRSRFEAAWFDRRGQLAVRDTVALLDTAGALGGAAVTIDAHGWPIVATSGTRIDLDGVIHDGPRAMVFRLGQGLERTRLADLTGVDIGDLDVAGDLVAIGGSYTGAPAPPEGSAPWPACTDPDPCGFVAAFTLSTGVFLWVQPIHAPGGASVRSVAIGGDQVVAMASAPGGAPTEPALGTGAVPSYLITLFAAGNSGAPAVVDQTILAEAGTVIGGGDLDVLPGGEVIVGLAFRGTARIGVQPLVYDSTEETYASVVAELGTDLIWQWTHFIVADAHQLATAEIATVAVQGDQVAVGGTYVGDLGLDGELEIPLPELSDDPNGFALEFHR